MPPAIRTPVPQEGRRQFRKSCLNLLGLDTIIGGLQINQLRHPIRIRYGKTRHLIASDRVSGHVNTPELQSVRNSRDVLHHSRQIVALRRLRRRAEAPSCDRKGPKGTCQPRSKVVEHVSCIAVPGKQQKGLARATPIQHLQLDARLHFNKANDVLRRIFPLCGNSQVPRSDQQSGEGDC
jgi:hypothetical protein